MLLRWSLLPSHGVALCATSVALLVSLSLYRWVNQDVSLLLFALAVVVAGWHGGLWPGLTATLLGVAAAMFFVRLPSSAPVNLFLFLALGATISELCDLLHQAQHKVERLAAPKQDDEELPFTERHFRELADYMPQIVSTAAPDGIPDYFNERWYEFTGFARSLGGEDYWTPILHPDDVAPTVEHWAMSVRTGLSYQTECRFKDRKTGNYRWFLLRGLPVRDKSGQIIKWIGTCTDIDDQKQAEQSLRCEVGRRQRIEMELRQVQEELEHRVAERSDAAEERTLALARSEAALRQQTQVMQSILDGIGEGVAVADETGQLTLLNLAAERLLGKGIISGGPQQWTEVYGLFRPDGTTHFPGEQLPLARAIRGEATDDCEMIIRNPYIKHDLFLTVTGRPLLHDGILVGGVVIFRDITSRKEAEVSLKNSLREKEVLLKEIHHRVKNNLQVISSLLYLQAQHTHDPASAEMFRNSQHRVRSMALVHERLYHSADLAQVDFTEYIQSLIGYLLHSYPIDTERIRLETNLEQVSLPIDTAIPCGLLINELVANCFKHAFRNRAGGVIRIGLVRDGADKVVLSVSDDGVGMPQGIAPGQSSTFGMQLIAALVQQLHGTIELQCHQGTTWKIAFTSPPTHAGKMNHVGNLP